MLVELQISRLIIIEEFQSFLFSLDTFLMVYEPSRDFSLSVAADLEVVAGALKLSTPLAAILIVARCVAYPTEEAHM